MRTAVASVEPPGGSWQGRVSTAPPTSTVGEVTLSVTYVVDTPRSSEEDRTFGR